MENLKIIKDIIKMINICIVDNLNKEKKMDMDNYNKYQIIIMQKL